MKKLKKLIKFCIETASRKVTIILIAISLVFFAIIIFLDYSNIDFIFKLKNETLKNILIGLFTNLIGIIITISFVEYLFYKQNEKKEKENEIKTIKEYDIILSIFIEEYIKYYKCITTPSLERTKEKTLKVDFKFEDMCDLYEKSLYVDADLFKPAITLFYDAEEKVRNYMIREIENIEFKYHNKLKNIFIEFIKSSLNNDMRSIILGYINIKFGDNKAISDIQKDIKDNSKHNWVDKFDKNELGSNLMLPYVILYKLLHKEIDLIFTYKNFIKNLDNSHNKK